MAKQIQLAIAPIAWTNDDMPELGSENTFEQCVSEMALAGFKGTEIGNKYPKDPQVLKQYLDIRGLKVASAWFSTFLTTKPFEETAEDFKKHRDFLHAMDAKVIVVAEQGHSIQGIMTAPVFNEKPIFSDEEWQKLAEGLEKLGDLAHEKGMEIVYHHHMGTGVQTTEEIDRLMKMTDPTKVNYCLTLAILSSQEKIQLQSISAIKTGLNTFTSKIFANKWQRKSEQKKIAS